jgi:outer membrane lipoprotein-sorting protein
MLIFTGLMVMFVLSACGTKSKDDVVKELSNKLDKLSSYKMNAKMTLKMGADSQVYNVEIWHKDPSYYRVNLQNAANDQSQMILRNDEGVFVLTPALNKSFRFQSDWPQNSSQAYLYESLIKDILEDKNAKFSTTKDYYVFETKTRYQNNKMLPFQEIKLNKSDLSPAEVKIMDPDRNTLVTVNFSKIQFNATFDKNDFDMNKNMTRAQLNLPAMANVKDSSFTVKYPTAAIAGTKLKEENNVKIEDGKRVVLTYTGKKPFTVIEEKLAVKPASTIPATSTPADGQPVDLGFTIGALTDHSISWSQNGIDYMIASEKLTKDELVELASSVQGDIGK